MYWEIKVQKRLGSVNVVVQDIEEMILIICVQERWTQPGAELEKGCQDNKGVEGLSGRILD